MPEKQDTTASETLKFRGSIYRILKSQKITSLAKISLTMQFNLIEPSCSDKYH